jgi:hypothetical protein
MFKKILLGIVAIVVVLVIASALSSGGSQPTQQAAAPAPTSAPGQPTQAPQAKPTATPVILPQIGETITEGNWAYRVTKVDTAKTVTWSEYGNKTDAKGEWVIVAITLKNIGKETYSLNTWDFEVHDSAGIKYKGDTTGPGMMYAEYKGGSSLSDSFPPGVQVETYAIFDVNPEAKGLKLWLAQAKKYVALE